MQGEPPETGGDLRPRGYRGITGLAGPGRIDTSCKILAGNPATVRGVTAACIALPVSITCYRETCYPGQIPPGRISIADRKRKEKALQKYD